MTLPLVLVAVDPDPADLLYRLRELSAMAHAREHTDPDYAVPEWVDLFDLLDTRLREGAPPPPDWR